MNVSVRKTGPYQTSIQWWVDRLAYFDRVVARYNEILIGMGMRGEVDELALLFPSTPLAGSFALEAVHFNPEVKLFNYADDTVNTYPIESEYGCSYYFLDLGSSRPYRLELMVLNHGVSPLHAAITPHAEGRLVHASFKTYDLDDYADHCKKIDEAEWVMAQGCESTYGVFSYYRPKDYELYDMTDKSESGLVIGGTYIKPRLNTRDGVPAMDFRDNLEACPCSFLMPSQRSTRNVLHAVNCPMYSPKTGRAG